MKRILTMLLAIILILSCCPNMYASAEESTGYSEAFANMDPHIKEILESQLSREERDALVALDPSLSDKMIFNAISMAPWHLSEKSPRERVTLCKKQGADRKLQYYFVFSDRVQFIEFREYNGKQTIWDMYPDYDFANDKYITDILNLGAQIELDGKLSTITDIYLFRSGGIIVCILTEEGALWKYYQDGKSEPLILSEKEFQKYGPDYDYYKTSTSHDEYGYGLVGYWPTFGEFLDDYDKYMAEADEMNAKRRLVQIKQAVTTYGSIAAGVVVVGGAVAIFVICRKRKKKALAAEISPDATEPIPDPIDPIVDTSDG